MIWAGMIIVGLIITGIVVYLWTRLRKIFFFRNLREKAPRKHKALAMIYLCVIVIWMYVQLVNTVVVLLHLAVFWAMTEGIFYLLQKGFRKKWKYEYAMGMALILTVSYLSVGWYNAHHVEETHYTVHTKKDLKDNKLRILQVTDMHIGATFDGEGFAEYMKEAERCKPDLVVVTGDFVDEKTTVEDMLKSCEALGEISSTYGVYFVYGNHDEGNYTSNREFGVEDLERALERNDVRILKDETVLIDDFLYVIGRLDRSEEFYEGRKEMAELVQTLDPSKFMLVLDHQPTDYENQKNARVDLVLSGHTHGGHLFPANVIGEWGKFNCMTYGIRTEENTTFEVSSGISGWEIPFKTFAISEYVVIDVEE